MAVAFLNFLVGLLSLFAITGVGRLLIRPLRLLALHWYLAISILAGFAFSSIALQCLALAGSNPAGFRLLGATIVLLGLAGHWLCRGRFSGLPLPQASPFRTFTCCLLAFALAVLVLITLAPSSKIDELFYHMLIGRRILEDHGLRVYQLPYEQAILPQMGYQIAETIFHATGTPDAGNILDLGFGMVMWLLIYGVVTEETGRAEVGLVAALASAVGIYPAVLYVTAGPHALGDLATFTAVAALWTPGSLAKTLEDTQDQTRSFACVLGAVCAASTKISILPIEGIITLAALFRLRGLARIKMTALATGLWLFIMGPLVLWTFIHTGSPFGAAFAQFFGRTVYQPAVLEDLDGSRRINQTGLRHALYGILQTMNAASMALILWGAVTCWRRWKRFGALFLLVALQLVLIAKFLPHDFRFLGGLQYGLLAVGALGLSALWPTRIPIKWLAAASLVLLGPWFAAELYFARPFLEFAVGLTEREDFLTRYVAFTGDFQALDKILPRDAEIYAPNSRLPAVDAPRRVILTLADWDHHTPLYRFFVLHRSGEPWGLSNLESQAGLSCGPVVYQNLNAVILGHRNPSLEPLRATLVVQRCY